MFTLLHFLVSFAAHSELKHGDDGPAIDYTVESRMKELEARRMWLFNNHTMLYMFCLLLLDILCFSAGYFIASALGV